MARTETGIGYMRSIRPSGERKGAARALVKRRLVHGSRGHDQRALAAKSAAGRSSKSGGRRYGYSAAVIMYHSCCRWSSQSCGRPAPAPPLGYPSTSPPDGVWWQPDRARILPNAPSPAAASSPNTDQNNNFLQMRDGARGIVCAYR